LLIFTGADISAQSVNVVSHGPVGWIFSALLALYAVLVIGALVSIAKSSHPTLTVKVVWFLIVVVAPFLGSILWFTAGKPRAPRGSERGR
jgi:hypothetical protein